MDELDFVSGGGLTPEVVVVRGTRNGSATPMGGGGAVSGNASGDPAQYKANEAKAEIIIVTAKRTNWFDSEGHFHTADGLVFYDLDAYNQWARSENLKEFGGLIVDGVVAGVTAGLPAGPMGIAAGAVLGAGAGPLYGGFAGRFKKVLD
jgi:hypothetical protein